MELFILRHGTAEDQHPQGDFHRALVEKGRLQAQGAGLLLKQANLLPNIVLTSPLVRTRQTAETCCLAAGLPAPVVQPWLASGMSPHTALDELVAFNSFPRVMIVGHEPDLSGLISHILETGFERIEIRKGTLTCLTLTPPQPRALLKFMIPPDLYLRSEGSI